MGNKLINIFSVFFIGVGALRPLPTLASQFRTFFPVSSCAFKFCQTAGTGHRPPYWRQVQATAPVSGNGGLDKWHLVRTPGPEKGQDVVSIMHTAELLQSDPEFAGLTIRCRSKTPLQIAFIVITPFRPRTHPEIAVSLNHSAARFKGEVIPPGTMVALPNEAETLLKGPWRSATELVVDIAGDGTKIHGIISLEGLSSALPFLQTNCPAD